MPDPVIILPETEVIITARECEFLRLLCSERTYEEIADVMCMSPRTAEGYRKRLFEKTGSKTRTGLVLFAIKNGIVILN